MNRVFSEGTDLLLRPTDETNDESQTQYNQNRRDLRLAAAARRRAELNEAIQARQNLHLENRLRLSEALEDARKSGYNFRLRLRQIISLLLQGKVDELF